jgi:quinol monooxygenase YgiN
MSADARRTLVARYRVTSGRSDEVAEALREMAEAVERDEPTCLVFLASRSIEEPEVFVLYEEYVDEAALLGHRETPHFRRLIEGAVVPLLDSREREVLSPVLDAPGYGAT